MTPCARGCCWVPMAGVCATKRQCSCHWAELLPRNEPRTSDARRYRDPTAETAIRNITKQRKKPR